MSRSRTAKIDQYDETLTMDSDQTIIFYKTTVKGAGGSLHRIWAATNSMPAKEAEWCLKGLTPYTDAFVLRVDGIVNSPEVQLAVKEMLFGTGG